MSDEEGVVLGVDLGTTFSATAIVNRFGKPEIITNAEGHPTTPSVVHFYDSNACVVGDEAVKMVVVDPANVVRFIKRRMGEADFVLDFYERSYTPQEISALILRKLKDDAEERLGHEVRDAVITVPAYFNSAQRGATAEAGAIAGFNVLSIINEPTAAAIAWGISRLGDRKKIMVFDLGGGTFDVTIMVVEGDDLTAIATDGNAELGGKDWDDRLLDFVADQFVATNGVDPRDDAIAYQELYERVLAAKISLSSKEHAVVPVNVGGRRTVSRVSRAEFEGMTADLVAQCATTCELVLERAKCRWRDLDEVLLVGGSTRMPMIRAFIEREFGRPANTDLNPDECVALGAALAGVLRHRPHHPGLRAPAPDAPRPSRPLPPPPSPGVAPRGAVVGLAYGGHIAMEAAAAASRGVRIQDVTSHPLGIVVLDRQRNERVVELIPEGQPVPHEYRGRFAYAYESMTAVRVEVTEGKGSKRDEVVVIGKVELRDLPPRPRGTPIEVIYRYGVDQILEVQVIDVETGASREGVIRLHGSLDDHELARARERTRSMRVE
jgi:molecular chaperone DnaK